MPSFLVWSLIFITVGSKKYLNLAKNFQLLKEVKYFFENQETQLNEFQGCFSYFQYFFPFERKNLILQAYYKYFAILVKNRERELSKMNQVTKYLNLPSFVADEKLQYALLNIISSLHYLLHPKGGLFNVKGLTYFILKSHLYSRQLKYMDWDNDKDDCGILSAIDPLHQFLYGWPIKGHKDSNELFNYKYHTILKSSSDEFEEESSVKIKRDFEPLKRRYSRTKRYNRKGAYIGPILVLLLFAFFLFVSLRVTFWECYLSQVRSMVRTNGRFM